MNLDQLLRDIDPIAEVTIPEPVLFDAQQICDTSRDRTVRPVDSGYLSRRLPVDSTIRCRRRRFVVAALAAALVVAAIVAPLTLESKSGPPTTTGAVSIQATWSLAGYITQPGWKVSSAMGPLPTTQQFTTQLTCPSTTICFTAGTYVPNSHENSQSEISVTNDGGAHWRVSLSPNDGTYFYGFTCPTVRSCMVAGNNPMASTPPSLYVTKDGGASWTSHPIPVAGEDPILLSCATTSTCVAIGYRAGPDAGAGVATAYFTSDVGDHWTQVSLPQDFVPSDATDALQCFPSGRCVVIGSTPIGTRGDGAAAALYSSNSGATWATADLPALSAIVGIMSCADDLHCTSIESTDNSSGFQVVSGALTSDDGAQSWTLLPSGGLTTPGAPGRTNFDSMSCSTDSNCWATGQTSENTCQGSCPSEPPDRAVIVATNDGGRSWVNQPLPPAPTTSLQYVTAYPVSCPAASACLAVGTLSLTQAASNAGTHPVQQDVVITNAASAA